MVTLNDLQQAGVFKTRIQLANAFDPKHEPEQYEAYKEVWVELRELNAQETQAVNASEGSNDALMKQFKNCLVDHNIYKDDEGQEKASNDQVMKLIRESQTLYFHVLEQWSNDLPLARRSDGESDKSDDTS